MQSCIQKFYIDEKNLSIIHIIINKYVIDDKGKPQWDPTSGDYVKQQ